jgi:hypothetical protein
MALSRLDMHLPVSRVEFCSSYPVNKRGSPISPPRVVRGLPKASDGMRSLYIHR